MQVVSKLGQAPFAPYHWLLYGESLWFDTTKAQEELGWNATHSNASMVIESYEWFLGHRNELDGEQGSRFLADVGSVLRSPGMALALF